MKIYTKSGDKGKTSLVGGKRVSKASKRVESYGTLDYLNSWIGRIIAQSKEKHPEIANDLEKIQHLLFDMQTDLASEKGEFYLKVGSSRFLEEKIDLYTNLSEPIKKFILPGGTLLASDTHIARTITRNAERKIVKLLEEEMVNEEILIFINRLSDYFFALAREFNRLENEKDKFYE
ncbi:MAG: cob(I)yrinic acid a,c-diamide adenosyltransferase [Streptococcaceae bacterium]|nr:cob(I)yrinic acid a,c-diamide adenosyltransferase [Streptococcaceae bacterium]